MSGVTVGTGVATERCEDGPEQPPAGCPAASAHRPCRFCIWDCLFAGALLQTVGT